MEAEPTEADPPELDLGRALAAEDERLELEARRLEQLGRRRSLDEARLRAQTDRPSGQIAFSGGASLGQPGGDTGGGGGWAGSSVPFALAEGRGDAPKGEMDPSAAFSPRLDRADAAASSKPTTRARRAATAALERARELGKGRPLEGKVSLTIRIDDGTQVKLQIVARGDGQHELALLVLDPKLRQELQRALPEIRSAASELPIAIADVWVDTLDEGTTAPHATLDDDVDPTENGVTA